MYHYNPIGILSFKNKFEHLIGGVLFLNLCLTQTYKVYICIEKYESVFKLAV